MKSYLIYILAILPACLFAQNDTQAQELLMKAEKSIMEGGVIHASFEGDLQGEIILKGEKFHLNSNGIQSWYDGETQWSYVAETEEVNISHPTPEELQAINPYLILLRYKTDFDYTYKGSQTRNGVKGHEIVLTPKHSGNREVIRVFISQKHQPLAMKIEQDGRTLSEISVISYKTDQGLEDGIFRFNKSLYPNVEIIDMR